VSENLGYEVKGDHDLNKYRSFLAEACNSGEQLASGRHEQPWRNYSHVILFNPDRQARSDPFLVVETERIAHQVEFDWESDSSAERMRPQKIVFDAQGAWGEEREHDCYVFIKISGKPQGDDFPAWTYELREDFYTETYGEVDVNMPDHEAFCRYKDMVSKYHRIAQGAFKLRLESQSEWFYVGISLPILL
jgi:hypothetical protein